MKKATQILDIELPKKTFLEQTSVEQTVLQVKDLQKELLVLRLAFGQLKAAVADAAAPLAAVFAPALTSAVRGATRLVKSLGQVIAGLLGVQVAQYKVEKTVVSAGKAAKRSVAGFDQLNRLQGNSGGQSVSTQTVPVEVKTTLSPEIQAVVTKIQEIFAPLQSIDLFPIRWAFARLQEQAEQFAVVAGDVLLELWQQVLAPLIAWVVEVLSPQLLGLGADVLRFLRVCLGEVSEGFFELVDALKPVAEFVGQVIITVFEQLRQLLKDTRISVEQEGSALGQLFSAVADAVKALWQHVGPVLEGLRQVFAETFQSVGNTVFAIMGYILDTVTGAIKVVTGLLTGDWSKVWQGAAQVCKGAVNSVIGVLNALLSGLAGAVNGVVKVLNKISVDVPDWVPGYGGKTFGFHLKEVKAPQIPYLAKGAVLPANKPFLAMVGDQKHGTNVEAPLATIQEAVAVTMEDFAQSNLAGHQATVRMLGQILEAVLGIHIGDAELYRAVERYRDKRAVMHGTGW